MTEAEWYKVTKDLIQALAWIGTVVAAAFAAFKAISEVRSNRLQRAEELRWKQANAAREIIKDLHSNNWADNATAILDWSEGKFHLTFEGNKRVEISYEKDVIPALSKRQSEYSDLDRDIVYCFDWFFYYINLIEHYIRIKLIEFKDVEDICRLYSKKIMRPDKLYETFMNTHSYTLAIDFWKRGSA
jgi:hypothetical protein